MVLTLPAGDCNPVGQKSAPDRFPDERDAEDRDEAERDRKKENGHYRRGAAAPAR